MNWLVPYLSGFGAAYAILLVAIASSGPGVAMLLGIALSQGRPAALAATVGATTNAPISVLAIFLLGAFLLFLIGHAAYAILLSSSPFRTAYNHARRWIEVAIGGFLTYVAFRLATERG